MEVGCSVGLWLGVTVGSSVGVADGDGLDGLVVGFSVGTAVGSLSVGKSVTVADLEECSCNISFTNFTSSPAIAIIRFVSIASIISWTSAKPLVPSPLKNMVAKNQANLFKDLVHAPVNQRRRITLPDITCNCNVTHSLFHCTERKRWLLC